jgi:hypothetical protein
VLALRPEEHELYESRWRTFEAEAAHEHGPAIGQAGDELIVGAEVPLPRRTVWNKPTTGWANFAQRRWLLAPKTRADIDERVIIQDLVVRQVTGDVPRPQMRGRHWEASAVSEVVE